LHTDVEDALLQEIHAERVNIDFGEDLLEKSENFAAQKKVAHYTLLLTVFKCLLARLTGEDDICIGTMTPERIGLEKEAIGCYANTIPLRTKFPGDLSFNDILRRVDDTVEQSIVEHGMLPFGEIIKSAKVLHQNGRRMFNKEFFILLEAGYYDLDLPDIEVEPIEEGLGLPKGDLIFQIGKGPKGLVGTVEYDPKIYKKDRISKLIDSYEVLLKSALKSPEMSLSDLNILTEDDKELIKKSRDTKLEHPDISRCFHIVFEEQLAEHKEEVAVVYCVPEVEETGSDIEFMTQSLSYEMLNTKANQLAHLLIERGIKKTDVIAVYLDRSIEWCYTVLGLMKCAIYMPLNQADPDEWLEKALKTSKTKIIITTGNHQERLSALKGAPQLVVLGSKDVKLESQKQENPQCDIQEEDVCYIIPTSGTTGPPKLVLNWHKGITNIAIGFKDAYDLNGSPRWLHAPQHVFDASLYDLFLALYHKIPLYILNQDAHLNFYVIGALLSKMKISMVTLTPSQAAHLGMDGGTLLYTGEPYSVKIAQPHIDRGGRSINALGWAEAQIASFYHIVELNIGRVPVGKPICNTVPYILDKSMHEVPIGIPGRLYIAGIGVGLGYLDLPDETSKRFFDNPFQAEDGYPTLFDTGDLVYLRHDGEVVHLTRIDRIEKIAGQLVDISGIESQVLKYKHEKNKLNIISSYIKVLTSGSGTKSMFVYYVVRGNKELRPLALYSYLEKKLPSYMIPSGFKQLEEMPLNSTGKINDNALPLDVEILRSHPYAPPEQIGNQATIIGIAKDLVVIWQEILGLSPDFKIGIDDNFFYLGGVSLDTGSLGKKLHKAFDGFNRFYSRGFYSEPTIRLLAVIIDDYLHSRDKSNQGIRSAYRELDYYWREAKKVADATKEMTFGPGNGSPGPNDKDSPGGRDHMTGPRKAFEGCVLL